MPQDCHSLLDMNEPQIHNDSAILERWEYEEYLEMLQIHH
jgi:hypothetical protein